MFDLLYEIVRKFNDFKFSKKVKRAINISKKKLKTKIKRIMKHLSKKEKKVLSLVLTISQKKLLSKITRKKII